MKIHYLSLALLGILTLCLHGCANDDTLSEFNSDEPTISVQLGIAGGGPVAKSRAMAEANAEDELTNECTMNNVLFLIYDNPLNSGESGSVIKTAYVDLTSTTISQGPETHEVYYYPYANANNKASLGQVTAIRECQTQFKANDLQTGTRYYALALVNFGDLSSTFRGMSLDALRAYIYKGALYDNGSGIKDTKNFRMTGINEVSFLYEKKTEFRIEDIFLVQRLASRLDLAFGKNCSVLGNLNNKNGDDYQYDFYLGNLGSDANGYNVVFPVYVTENQVTSRSTTSFFYLTDVMMVDTRNQAQTGMYLIERSSETANGTPLYFGNEGWTDYNSTTCKYEYASRYVLSPSTGVTYNAPYSLVAAGKKAGDLILDGNINTTHSVVGYFSESTNDEGHEVSVRICGWTNANTSSMFAEAPRRPDSRADATPTRPSYVPEGYKYVTAEIPIRHNIRVQGSKHDAWPLEYATVRNTIYRIFIKVYAVENKIYFRYYYYDNPNTKEDKTSNTNYYPGGSVEATPGFNSQISETVPDEVND